MTEFKHENMIIDLTTSSKTKLYKDDKLVFIGDGYKAISMMIKNSNNQQPVREKFHNQLTMREKPKFGKGDDIEALRKQALDEHIKNQDKNKKSKKRN